MNFENLLNFSEFIADPEAAIKKAQQLMEEAVQEEKRQLQARAAQQEAANRAAYQAALQALKQQYEEMREAEGLNELQKKVDSYQISAADSAVSRLQSEVDRLKKENEKLKQEKEKNADTIERVKEKAKETAPKSGTAAHDAMKKFYDSNADAATKDKVRFMPSDEALEYIAQLDAGLTPEEIEERGYSEVQPNGDESQQTEWGQLN